MAENKKKIIYLVTQSEWGGAQKYIYDLATNLPKDRFDILVAAGEGDNELFNRLEDKKIPVYRLKHIVRAIRPIKDLLALFELIKLFKKEKPDIIHLNSSKISILGSLAAKSYKSKTIYTVHGWVFNEPLHAWKKKFYYYAEKLTARWKNLIITVSEYDHQIALKNKIADPKKLITITNGISQLNFLEAKLAKNELLAQHATQDKRLIGTIANLYPTKGIEYLIKAAAELIKNDSNLIFIVIGQGSERKKLEQLIKNNKLTNNFLLLGKIDKAYKYLKAFDIFVLPSVKEGWPYTLLEALSAGLPIVATKVGGVPEIICDQKNGLLVTAADEKSLAKAINELISNPKLVSSLKQNSLESSQRFDFKNTLEKTLKIY